MAVTKSPATSVDNSRQQPSPSPASSAMPAPAQLAKAALRRLAEQRQEPTPDNYRKAYEAESGVPSAAPANNKPAPDAAPVHAEDGERWSALISRILRGSERGGRQWTAARKKDSLKRVLEGSKSSADRLHQRLTQLVGSWDSDTVDSTLLESDEALPSETAGQDAATATSDEAASSRVAAAGTGDHLEERTSHHGSRLPDGAEGAATSHHPAASDLPASAAILPALSPALQAWPQLALHALDQLSATVTAALPDSQAPSLEAAQALHAAVGKGRDTATPPASHEQVKHEIAQACEQARRIIDHRHHLIAQLTDLCLSLTESLADLSEDDSWAQGQCAAMRHQLNEGLHNRGVRHVQQLLADTRAKQRVLKQEREAARQALKQLIHQMLHEIAELGSTTDRFHTSLGRYADTIGQAESLESLAGVVREMVEESRAVQSVVAQTQNRLNDEHTRATQLGERVRELEDEIRKLSDEVSTDPLTQIANRRGMMRAFEIEQAKMARDGTTLAIGLLDVDNFKKLNDSLGHQTGDEALKFLSRRVTECLRPIDVVARYGGEEFVVMLPGTPLEEAQQVLTRLQRTLSAEFFTHEDKKVFITFSAGVTLYRSGEAIEAALDRADVALYEAKRTGKNRTCMG